MSTPVTSAIENSPLDEYDSDDDEEYSPGAPLSSFNLTADTWTTYPTTPESQAADVLDLINQLQLQSNLPSPPPAGAWTASGLHFINSSTDVVVLRPFGVTPSSVVDIDPITDSFLADESGSLSFQVGVKPVVGDEETPVTGDSTAPLAVAASVAEPPAPAAAPSDSIVVDAAPSLVGALPPSVPNVNPNANLFLTGSESVSIPILGGTETISLSSSSSSSSGSTSTSTSSSSTSTSVVTVTAFVASLAAAAYVGAVLLPIWLPVVLKKRRRSYTYGPSRSKYQPPSIPGAIGSYSRADGYMLPVVPTTTTTTTAAPEPYTASSAFYRLTYPSIYANIERLTDWSRYVDDSASRNWLARFRKRSPLAKSAAAAAKRRAKSLMSNKFNRNNQ